MAPKYKLTYLNVRGLAEPIRFLLEYGGVDWEDCRIENGPQIQEVGLFGKVPVLEVDGKKVHQSVAICRYLAKQFKLAGDSDWEAFQIDMIVDTVMDLRQQYKYIALVDNKEEAAKMKADFLNETLHYYLTKFESIVESNGGYFVNGKLTWADFYYAHFAATAADLLRETTTRAIAIKYPLMEALKVKMFELPAIKAWVAKRPKPVTNPVL